MKRALRPLYRNFTIPIHSVLKAIFKQEVLKEIYAVELFGRDGDWLTKAYAPYTSSLQIWEIDASWEQSLRSRFPNAIVKIVDSFEEVKKTSDRFNFIVIDNPMSTYGRYCEHFELFTNIYRMLCDKSVIILNVIPRLGRFDQRKYPYIFNAEHLRRRAEFYDTDCPEDISIQKITEAYKKMSEANGYTVRWDYAKKRGFSSFYFLAIYLESNMGGPLNIANLSCAMTTYPDPLFKCTSCETIFNARTRIADIVVPIFNHTSL